MLSNPAAICVGAALFIVHLLIELVREMQKKSVTAGAAGEAKKEEGSEPSSIQEEAHALEQSQDDGSESGEKKNG